VRRYLHLLQYVMRYWKGRLFIFLVTVLSGVLGLLQPWPMKILVDNVLGHKSLPPFLSPIANFLPGGNSQSGLLAWVAVATLAVFAINSSVDVVLSRAWILVGRAMVYDLAADMFARLQRRSLHFHSQNSVGDSMARITGDSWSVFTLVETLVFGPALALVTTVTVLVVLLRMDPLLTLVGLAAAPGAALVSLAMGRRIRRAARQQRDIQGEIQSHVQRTLAGMPVVQSFAGEERHSRRFRSLADLAIRSQRRNAVIGSWASLGRDIISVLAAAVVLWVGAQHVLSGQLTVGSLLVFLAYLSTLRSQVGVITGTYAGLQGVGASVDRVMEILEAEPEVREVAHAPAVRALRGHVRIERVWFGYEPEWPVLRDVSLEARPGETVAIVGPTGAGKSTLMGLIPRFFDPWEGRVLVDGRDVREVQVKSLREQVALVLQEPFLFPMSIAENIAYGRSEATREEVVAAAVAANADAFIRRLPDGYETVVGERGATLSGGERQRISIARALLKDAPILILDEPTSSLDAETEALLLEALERLMAGRTTFIIAHRLSTIRQADRIAVLHDGQIAELDTHDALLARDGLYARLHSLQHGQVASVARTEVEAAG
jgi:ATP-binding cassette, subfamily B, bacterial